MQRWESSGGEPPDRRLIRKAASVLAALAEGRLPTAQWRAVDEALARLLDAYRSRNGAGFRMVLGRLDRFRQQAEGAPAEGEPAPADLRRRLERAFAAPPAKRSPGLTGGGGRRRRARDDTFDYRLPAEMSRGPIEPSPLDDIVERSVRGGGGPEDVAAERPPAPEEELEEAAPDEPPPEPPDAPPEGVDMHLKASIPAQIVAGRTTTVVVELGLGAVAEQRGGPAGAGSGRADADKPIIVQVLPRQGFSVPAGAELREEAELPSAEDPHVLFFDLVAGESEHYEVWVLARQGAAPLVKLELTAKPGAPPDAAPVESVAAFSPPRDAPAPLARFEITEHPTPNGVVYWYELDIPHIGVFKRFPSPEIQGDRNAYVGSLYAEMEKWAKRPPSDALLVEGMRTFGGALFDRLFPSELRALLWEHREALQGVMVVSTEPFIPWELVHLKTPDGELPDESWFLGQLGVVRWLWGTKAPEGLVVRADRVRHVIPFYKDVRDSLPATGDEREFVEDELGAVAVDPSTEPVFAALRERDGFDLMHLAGHATAETTSGLPQFLLDGTARGRGGEVVPTREPLYADTVKQLGRFGSDEHRPIVVLNACQAGRGQQALTGLGGFAEAFLDRKAGAFVGALWAVGDKPALTFVQALYTHLRAGETFGEATMAARAETKAAGDPTWLAYVVYAHPAATVEWV